MSEKKDDGIKRWDSCFSARKMNQPDNPPTEQKHPTEQKNKKKNE